MNSKIIQLANEYNIQNIPYAMALVVRREEPTSGKQGDQAIIFEDGKVIGWIGGGCTKPVVINEAKIALKQGTPRMIRISPNTNMAEVPGIKNYEMTCYSGGSVDVYIEPVLGKPEMIILGRSAIAQSIAKLANQSNFKVSIYGVDEVPIEDGVISVIENGYDLTDRKISSKTNIIISTQGEKDEKAIENVLATQAGYIGFVVSRKKWQTIYDLFRKQGYTEEQLLRINAPAGIDINAKKPDEVAISILAQIIKQRNHELIKDEKEMSVHENLVEIDEEKYRIDPVCKMTVEIATAEHSAEYKGTTYYFCCPHCKDAFITKPHTYII